MGLIYNIGAEACNLRIKDLKLTKKERESLLAKLYSKDAAANASARILLWGEDNRFLNHYVDKAIARMKRKFAA